MKNLIYAAALLILISCQPKSTTVEEKTSDGKTVVLFDTDANNELDDQHAMAYLFFNGNTFNVKGVTVNATRSGGDISKQVDEAARIMKLCTVDGKIPLHKGANASFDEIKNTITQPSFDGSDAVNFIIAEAKKQSGSKLVLLAVGKLTNVALALKKDPSVADNIRLVWLGSNYPDPGEYNMDNDTASVNFVLRTSVDFEMVTVRYGKPSGSGAVQATHAEISQRMPGKGPHIADGTTGRHGGTFNSFGDYSANLFDHIDYHSDPPSRALFDMVAVAVVKNPGWGHAKKIPAPALINSKWVDNPKNTRMITIWENFDTVEILKDFYASMDHYSLVTQ